MNLKETIEYYLECGINCMPIWLGTTDSGKRTEVVPGWKAMQTKALKPGEIDSKFTSVRRKGKEPNALAIITGPTSGHLSCLDIDIKNAEEAGHNLENALSALNYFCEDYWDSLVIEKTWSGGLHIWYRKSGPSKTDILELARSVTGKELIAEMNNKKIIYAEPSPNYQLVQGGWDEIPVLTDDQLGSIYAFARAWDESGHPVITNNKGSKTPSTKNDGSWEITPWDDFKEKHTALEIAINLGWTVSKEESGRTILTRPGSDVTNAKSAIYEHDKRILWVLTTSVPQLLQHHQYDAYSLYAYAVHGGDFTAAAREAAKNGYGKAAPAPDDEDDNGNESGKTSRGRPKLDVWDCVRNYLVDIQCLKLNSMTGEIEKDGNPVPETSINQYYIDIHKRHPKVKGLNWQNFDKVLKSDMIPAYHPLEEFFESVKDLTTGGKVIDELISCIEPMDDFRRLCMRRWLIGIPGNVYKRDNIPNILMPVLYGDVSQGKTEFFRRLMPSELKQYSTEDEFNPDQVKDSQEKMVKNILVCFDEFHLSKKVDARSFRQFISAHEYDYRAPYGRKNEKRARMATLAATSNHSDFVDEAVYNRRIIPIHVEKIDHDRYNAIDKRLLMAECYQRLLAGDPYVLTRKESLDLSQLSKDNEPPSQIEELIIKWLVPAEAGEVGMSKMTTTEILNYLEGKARMRLSGVPLVWVGRKLKELGFEQVKEFINKKQIRVYYVKKLEENEVDIESDRIPGRSSDKVSEDGEDLPF